MFNLIELMGLVLQCLMQLSAIFHIYRGGKLYWWRKREYPEKTTDLPQATDKFYRIMLYLAHLTISLIRTHSFSNDRHWLNPTTIRPRSRMNPLIVNEIITLNLQQSSNILNKGNNKITEHRAIFQSNAICVRYINNKEWVSDCCLMPTHQFFSSIMARTS